MPIPHQPPKVLVMYQPPEMLTPTYSDVSPAPQSPKSLQRRTTNSEVDWFLAYYLPIIIAALYQIFWSYVYANVKLMVPFSQMTSLHGGGDPAQNILRT